MSEKIIGNLDKSINFDIPIKQIIGISSDLTRIGLVIETGDKYHIVVDGNLSKPYDDISINTFIFSPDSKHFAFAAKKGGKWLLNIDDTEHKIYDFVLNPIFSLDSRRISYIASDNNKQFVVVDGAEKRSFDFIGTQSPIFSPNGQRVAYVAGSKKRLFVVIDEKEIGPYEDIGDHTPVFSPDSKRVAFRVIRKKILGREDYIVVDDREHTHYDGLSYETIFTPDNQKVVYAAYQKKKWFMVTDQEEGKRYDGISLPYISPDGKKLAYMGRVGKKEVIVLDGIEGNFYETCRGLTFSPDSQQYAYFAQVGEKYTLVKDGKEGKRYKSLGNIAFSPDNKILVYTAYTDGQNGFLVINEKEEKPYELAGKYITFSTDSKHIAYVAMSGGQEMVIIDGLEGKRYDNIPASIIANKIVFNILLSEVTPFISLKRSLTKARLTNYYFWIVVDNGHSRTRFHSARISRCQGT